MLVAVLLISLFAVSTDGERQVVEVDTSTKSDLTDLSGTGLTRDFCVLADKECPGDDLGKVTFSPTLHGCRVRCAQDRNCLSMTWTARKKCHIRETRCPPGTATDAPGATTLYRLKEGESCPNGQPPYVANDYNFSKKFCVWGGKACPGRDLYFSPFTFAQFTDCLIKCVKIPSCGGADYIDGKCYPKEAPFCEDDELVDNPQAQNYLRLENGVNECSGERTAIDDPYNPPETEPEEPSGPEPENPACKSEAPADDCTGLEYTYMHRQGECVGHDIAKIYGTLEACKTACSNDCRCKSIHTRGNECFLKNYACTNDELTTDPDCHCRQKQYHDYVKV